ncbi:hypothetical protein [Nitrosomonas sp. Nm51]|uniref:hypothetical protein n=1 Tax=Nitrosomonas sp. Nm51 TaxID=133720 RepID=UPI000B879588|nr:hypothetical protein [Nitrosomonas sp. Nm51]
MVPNPAWHRAIQRQRIDPAVWLKDTLTKLSAWSNEQNYVLADDRSHCGDMTLMPTRVSSASALLSRVNYPGRFGDNYDGRLSFL